MRTRHDYITLLRQYAKAKAEVYGIMKIGIFGSVARNEQPEDSDVDICVEISKTESMYDFKYFVITQIVFQTYNSQ